MDRLQNFCQTVAIIFALSGILFIPFPFHIFPYQHSITNALFGSLIRFTADISGLELRSNGISSDSTSLYVLGLILFILALIASIVLHFTGKCERFAQSALPFARKVICYYLALQLFKYGFDKIFKAQFYIPEPNTLYTPFGMMSKDILYWSTMGVSRSYSIFLGIAEVIPAILLLFSRTRAAGLLLATIVLLNIVAVNMSFDISVKLYSLFLLFLSLAALAPHIRALISFFISRKPGMITHDTPLLPRRIFLKASLKTFITAIILLEALHPYFASGSWNDDNASRPYLHGAWQVERVIMHGDTLESAKHPVKRFFFHRRGYLIFQGPGDAMRDYKAEIDSIGSAITLTDYNLHRTRLPYSHNKADSTIRIVYMQDNKKFTIEAKQVDWRKLPALRDPFHWTVDEVE